MLDEAHVHDTEARILDAALRADSSKTRIEIARQLDLTPSSVTRAIERMQDARILEDVASGARREVHVLPDAARLAGVTVQGGEDEGGCVVRGAIVDLQGQLITEVVEQQLSTTHWGPVTDAATLVLNDLDRADGPITAAGLAVGGHVDSRDGIVYYSPNLDWNSIPLGPNVERHIGRTVVVENDANALALYDRLYGDGRKEPWFASILIGRGVGLGFFAGTAVAVGRSGRAGELGHIWVSDDNECRCGRVGCLEAQIGSAHLLKRLRSMTRLRRDVQKISDVALIADKYPNGPVAEEIRRCGELLGRALATVCNLTDVNLLIIRHTGLFDSEIFNDAVRRELNDRLFPSPGTVQLPPPMQLTYSDVIRGAAAAALFRQLRDHGVTGLRSATVAR